jgi:hypothetical protein
VAPASSAPTPAGTPAPAAARSSFGGGTGAAEGQADPAPPAAESSSAAEAAAAAQAVKPVSQARETWARRGRTHKLILRPRPIDTITDGRLTKRTQRAGRINLTSLSRIVPNSFLDISGDTARLNPTPPADAACLYTGRGKMSVTGVTMTSVDGHGQPLAANAQGRPYIAVSSGGRFDATDATLGDRGVQPSGTDKGEPAMSYNISYNTDATGTLLRTSVVRNTTGAELSRSRNVRLDAVSVVEPWSDGLLLQGDKRTVMKAITASATVGMV